jgi:hypothetical protein
MPRLQRDPVYEVEVKHNLPRQPTGLGLVAIPPKDPGSLNLGTSLFRGDMKPNSLGSQVFTVFGKI